MRVQKEDRPYLFRIARYGLPLVVLVFYLTSVTAFSYTPDTAFLPLQWVHNVVAGLGFQGFTGLPNAGSPSPLWIFLISLGASLQIDALLLAKILSLFFSCLILVLSYLVTHDLTDDPVMALCMALVGATSGWLLEASPSGTPCTLLGTLLLASIFCIIRQDSILAAILLALSCLMAWQAAILLVPYVVDLWLSDVSRSKRLRLLTISYILLTSLLVPWILYANANNAPWWPEHPLSGLSASSSPFAIAVILLVGAPAIAGGLLLFFRKDGEEGLGKRHAVIWCWIVWLAVCSIWWDGGFLLALFPLLGAYMFIFFRVLLRILGRSERTIIAAFLFTAALMVLQQLDYVRVRRVAMEQAQESGPVLTELAYWIKSSVPDDVSVSAEWPGMVGYVAGRPVSPLNAGSQPTTEYAITSETELHGYIALRSAAKPVEDIPSIEQVRFLIWKRN